MGLEDSVSTRRALEDRSCCLSAGRKRVGGEGLEFFREQMRCGCAGCLLPHASVLGREYFTPVNPPAGRDVEMLLAKYRPELLLSEKFMNE